MRLTLFASLGALFLIAAVAAACGGSGHATGSSAGTGGTGGGAVASTAAVTSAGSGGSGGGNDPGMPSTTYPAPHPSGPTVFNLGGGRLQTPVFVPIFFSNDDAAVQALITDFVKVVGGTKYWAATTSEYGIAAATSAPPVVLTEAAPATIDDAVIQTWLAGKIASGAPGFPVPDGNTLYLVHYPQGTTITQSFPGLPKQSSCQQFGGYHGYAPVTLEAGVVDAPYAVIPRCAHFNGYHGIDAVTAGESHEMIEAVTDPFVDQTLATAAYAVPDDAHAYWVLYNGGGGEVGDMCAQVPGAFTKFSEMPYLVQRTWSNQASLAGQDPCVPPLPGEVYIAAVPVLRDKFVSTAFGATMTVVKVPANQSKTIEIDLFSSGDTGGAWDVSVEDLNAFLGMPSNLNLTLDRTSGQNGEKLYLTISPSATGQYGLDEFVLTSTSGNLSTIWVGAVAD